MGSCSVKILEIEQQSRDLLQFRCSQNTSLWSPMDAAASATAELVANIQAVIASKHQRNSGWWLGHPSEKYESQLGWLATQYMRK